MIENIALDGGRNIARWSASSASARRRKSDADAVTNVARRASSLFVTTRAITVKA
jgi:hypothetical protein